jgi:hypothetical protein
MSGVKTIVSAKANIVPNQRTARPLKGLSKSQPQIQHIASTVEGMTKQIPISVCLAA